MQRRPRRKWFDSEAEMAALVVQHLRATGWTVYQEVQTSHYGCVADIVGQKGDDLLVVETKLQVSLAVLAQAHNWQRHANLVAIAVPHIALQTAQFVRTLCTTLGYGLWVVHAPAFGLQHRSYEEIVSEIIHPRRGMTAFSQPLRDALVPERQDYAQAGNANGRRYTPFTATRDALIAVVAQEPGIELKEAVQKIKHHYAHETSARQSLLYWIKRGKFEGVRAQKTAGKWWLYPTSSNAEASALSRS